MKLKSTISVILTNWLLFAVIAFLVFAIYLQSAQTIKFINKSAFHYIGTSEITQEQYYQIVSKDYGYFNLSKSNELQNGNIQISYDFYSTEEISYLNQDTNYKFTNTPLYKDNVSINGLLVWSSFILVIILSTRLGVVLKYKIIDFIDDIKYKESIVPIPKFNSNIKEKIIIESKNQGIISLRTWKQFNGVLYSAVRYYRYNNKVSWSNKEPEEKNKKGLYGYRLGTIKQSKDFFNNDIIGIVSLKGKYEYHENEIIRAEYCEILYVIINEKFKRDAEKLSMIYDVPVIISKNPKEKLQEWLFSENGIECLKHNVEILK